MRKIVLLASPIAVLTAIGASPAAPGTTAIVRPFTMTMTYSETNHGRDSGGTTTGVVGQGKVSMRISGPKLAGVPITMLTIGGSYVARYDIDTAGKYHGVMVVTPPARALGSVCLGGTVAFGRYDPNAGTGFPPSSGSLTSVGGTGLWARLGLVVREKLTSVVGRDNLKIGVAGKVAISSTAPKPPSKACLAVAKLAR